MRATFVAMTLALASASALCQQSNPVAIFLGVPADLSSGPATFNLIPKEPGARTGKIWVRYAEDGLHIYGQVDANPNDVRWPVEKKDMLSSDHAEVWLSTTANIDMPPIGYGNQFGETDLKTPEDCVPKDDEGKPGDPNTPDVAACRRWYATQLEYRKQFERLFTRQWLTAPAGDQSHTQGQFEDFATSAYHSLSDDYYANELPEILRPKADDGFTSNFNSKFQQPVPDPAQGAQPVATGYIFDILIPWSAFPPSNETNLHYLWLMVDVFTHAPDGKKMGALSTTSPTRVWGKPSSFNQVVLNVPRTYSITPCQAASVPNAYDGKSNAEWYFPTSGDDPLILNNIFYIENPAVGYMYSPSGVSPIVRAEEQFWKTLPDGSTICGPELLYRKGKVTKSLNVTVAKKYFDAKQLDDGWLMVRSGPDMSTVSPLGTGMCGSCPVVDLDMYAVSPNGDVTTALALNNVFSGEQDEPADADFSIAPDWSKIVYYVDLADASGNDQDDKWSSTTYCLKGHKYEQCGEEKSVKRPDPPNFKLQLDQ